MVLDRGVFVEILKKAVESEIESRLFYEELAGKIPPSPLRERIEELARDEARHQEILTENFLQDIDTSGIPEVAAGRVSGVLPKDGMTLASMLALAIDRERQAEESYKSMAQGSGSHDEFLLLLRLAEFERVHKVKLQRELEGLDGVSGSASEYGRFL